MSPHTLKRSPNQCYLILKVSAVHQSNMQMQKMTIRVPLFGTTPELVNDSSRNFTSAQKRINTAVSLQDLSWLKVREGKMQIYKRCGHWEVQSQVVPQNLQKHHKISYIGLINIGLKNIVLINECQCTSSTSRSSYFILSLTEKRSGRVSFLCKWKTMEWKTMKENNSII